MSLRRLRTRLSDAVLWGAFGAVLVFLYTPIVVVVLFSFDTNQVMSWPISGFTLDWYERFFQNEELITAFGNSIRVAVSSIVIGLLIGIPSALAMDRYQFPGRGVYQKLLILPFVIPGVLGGLTLLTVFLFADVDLSLTTVTAAHATLVTAAVVLQMSVGLARWDRGLEQAAMDLGANELRTFFSVTLPNLKSTIMGAILLGATLSLDEVTRTFFVTGSDNTAPMQVWSLLRQGITPEINAAATLLFVISIVLLGIWASTVKEEAS